LNKEEEVKIGDGKSISLKDDPGLDTEKYLITKLRDIKVYAEMRDKLDEFITQKLIAGTDYGTTDPRSNKQTLKKSGAEKVDILLGLEPIFLNDEPTWKMFGSVDGTVCLICYLMTHSAKRRAIELMCSAGISLSHSVCSMLSVGEGRGCGNLTEKSNSNANDIIKRTQKRAQVDATLRVAGLSERFTQDMEEGEEDIGEDKSRVTKITKPISVTKQSEVVVPKDVVKVLNEEYEENFLEEGELDHEGAF
jgi:hypothetical protein